jgi:hypothetical protein
VTRTSRATWRYYELAPVVEKDAREDYTKKQGEVMIVIGGSGLLTVG